MNQPEHTSTQDEKNPTPSTYPPQSFAPTIKRKPLATITATEESKSTYQPPHTKPSPPTYPSSKPQTQSRPRNLLTHFLSLPLKLRLLYLLPPVLLLLLLIIILPATLTHKSHLNLPLPTSHGGPYTGDLTYYAPGLGACGQTSTSKDNIVSISHFVFDAVSTSSNPNANPLCGKKIRARRNDKSVDLTVVDRCTGCQPTDLDVSIAVFGDLADVDAGRVRVEWAWLEDVPGSITGNSSASRL